MQCEFLLDGSDTGTAVHVVLSCSGEQQHPGPSGIDTAANHQYLMIRAQGTQIPSHLLISSWAM